RSLEELQHIYETQPINTISRNDIITSLYDEQTMILYTRSGNIVSTEPTDQLSGLPIDFVPVSDKVITSLETGDGNFLVGRSSIDRKSTRLNSSHGSS